MAGQREVRAIGPSYYLRDAKTAVQRAVNLYMMQVEGLGEDSPVVLESAPGLEFVADLGAEIRGLRNADGRFFVAAGAALKEMSAAEVFTDIGTLSTSSGFVSMANGTGQLAAVDGGTLYVLNLDTGAFAAVTADGWRGSNSVSFLDGYFIFSEPGTEQFYISAIDDASSLDALDFTSTDRQPDKIVAHLVTKAEAYFLGGRSTEIWVNSGGTDFPLARYQGTPIDVGCVGPRAAVAAADSVVFVGVTERGGPYVYLLAGYQPVRISTQAVEQWLERSTDISQARCWTYQEAGSEFVAFNAPGLESTWVWDAATKQWHERADFVDGDFQPFRIEHVAYFNGKHYAAGGSKLYRMSRAYHSLAGDVLCRERTWPHLLGSNLEPVSYRGLEVRCTTGDATPGNITLEISNDGGQVFTAGPYIRSLGEVGQRNQVVRWGPLGTCPKGGSRVFRLRCTDAVPLTIQGATVL